MKHKPHPLLITVGKFAVAIAAIISVVGLVLPYVNGPTDIAELKKDVSTITKAGEERDVKLSRHETLIVNQYQEITRRLDAIDNKLDSLHSLPAFYTPIQTPPMGAAKTTTSLTTNTAQPPNAQ